MSTESVVEEEEAAAAVSTTTQEKVKVHFVAVGSAPLLKKTKFQISAAQPFAAVTAFLRKLLKLNYNNHNNNQGNAGASLFLYIQSAFVPGPEELIGDIQKSFGGGREELVVHYSLQEAWG